MLPNSSFISCNFSTIPSLAFKIPIPRISLLSHPNTEKSYPAFSFHRTLKPAVFLKPSNIGPVVSPSRRKDAVHTCQNSLGDNDSKDPVLKEGDSGRIKLGDENFGGGRDWTTSILLFILWAALLYYVFNLTPNQTPSRDMYFVQKLLNLKGDDGFRMNKVLVSLWYIMGLWPLVYSMLLVPAGRSSKSKIPVWPFLLLSCFGGAYALLPYFVLWTPPPPPVDESELGRWPLNFLESKLISRILIAAGLGIMTYASLADGDVWKEFYQYFRESKFIHVTCLDFVLLSAFAPFWVYNDMAARKWLGRGSWLIPLALVPFLGPALYLILRPSLSTLPTFLTSTKTEED